MIRKRLLSILILLLLTFNILVVLNLNTIRISAAEYPAVYIEPATTVDPTLTLGSTYTVSVKTDYTGDDINSWQFTLGYNPSVLKIGINGLNFTDIWAGTGTKKSFEATGKLIVPDSEDVYVGGVLKTKGVDYTIDYQTGMITFTTAPAKGVEVKATYLYCLINGDLITKAINTNAMFNPGTADNVAGKLTLTGAFFFYIFPPAPLTSGPGTLANVTFTVVGYGTSNITLGPETKLIGITEDGMGDAYSIVDGALMPENLGHGYFNNLKPIHDVAVVSLDAPAQANIGEIVPIDVTVINEGDFTETFDVTVYANTTEIGTQSVTDLGVGTQTTLNFIWNTAGLAPGTYTINATAIITLDDDPSNNFKTTPIVLVAPPPVADANGPYLGSEGTPITFDASGSTPNGGVIVLYEWDWNNDGTYDESTTSPFIDHTWPDDYAGTVGLRVTDSEGLKDTDVASVSVYNVAPTVNAGPDQAVNEGDLVSFVGSFTDPGLLDTHTIFWDFGDGSNATGTLTPTHVYTKAGVYTVTLNVTDDDGGSGTDTLTVTVSTVAVHDMAVISVVPSSYVVYVGDSVNIDVIVENQGNVVESFTVNVYAGLGLIGTKTATLGAGASETYTFTWYPAKGSFLIWAEVSAVPGEVDTADNFLEDGTVVVVWEGTLDFFDAADMDHTVTWVKGSEPGTYPYFDVKVMVTNVSKIYSVIFSVVWDPAILDLTGITPGDATYDPTKTMFGPAYTEWNHATGELRGWVYGQLSPDATSVKTYTDPNWGWVATLRFRFVGTPPAAGYPVDTYINLTHLEPDYRTGWWKLVDYKRRPFAALGSCHFHYEALIHDVAVISVVPSPTEVIRGESVDIEVIVKNEGNFTETFNVKVYANTTEIGVQAVTDLVSGAQKHLAFTWNTAGVAPGLYTVTAEAVLPEDADPTDNIGSCFVIVRLLVGNIAGRVTDASTGNPIEGASVIANGYSDITDADGQYNIIDVPAGTYSLTASATGYHSNTTVVAVIADATKTVNLTLEPILVVGWINGTVIDVDFMLPIAGASVTADGYSTTTNGFGYYEMEVEPGTYTVTVEADGYFSESVVGVVVIAGETTRVDFQLTPIVPPVASFTYSPLTPYTGETVTFDATTSYDPDGTIVSYEWDFGDGSTGAGKVTTHIYLDDWTYTVTLTVTDNDGLDDTASAYITVLNKPPVASFTESAETVYTGVAITFNAGNSYDPDGTIISYFWDFGDGNTASGVIVDHAYADNGAYTVTLTVTDDDEATDSAEATKTVLNRPPVASFVENATTVLTGEVIRFDASISYDPDGSIVSYSWNFGDGTIALGVIVEHAYEDDGTYTVTLTVTDDDGATKSADAIKTVLNRPPVASFTWSPSVPKVDETVTFDASASYDPDGTIVNYEWDFGDGTSITETVPVTTHTYTADGTYTVVLTVTDDGAPLLSDTSSVDITVSLLPVHDIAVDSVVPSTYEVLVGNSVLIRVTVVNQGNQPESFTVKAYANTNLIGSTSGSLAPGEIRTYIISWITTTSGSFVIKGEVPPVAEETDTTDNVLEDGTVEVLPIPVTPVALFTEDPETPRVNEVVTFDASASYDPDGYIVGWSWDFGDGNSASGEVVSHTYLVAGDYNVTLTVTDDDGLADTAWHIKTVLPIATGTLTVTTTPVSGEVFVNGTSWGLAPQSRIVLVGTYNVSFGDVAGYYTPDWRLATVSENVETVVEGVYKPITAVLNAMVDLDPDTLNLKSEGRWITCYIRLPEGYDVRDINVSTILLDGVVPAEWGNVEGNVLMVKFDRQAVIEYIRDVLEMADGEVTLTVTGKLYDETMFEGSDTIRVISRGRRE